MKTQVSTSTPATLAWRVGRRAISLVALMALAATSFVLASAPAQAVIPAAPTIDSITAGNVQLSVAFTAGNDGGETITTYQYTTNGGTNWETRTTGTTASPIVITETSLAGSAPLVNGTQYNVAIRAVNGSGNGAASTVVAGIPATTPGAPTAIVITPGDASLSVAFVAPASTGGSAISTYEYSTDGGTNWKTRTSGTTASPIVITQTSAAGTTALVNGTSYNVQLRATNGMGSGTATATTASTPRTLPGAPTALSVAVTSGTQLTATFTAPSSNGGSALLRYEFSTNNGATWTTTGSTATTYTIGSLTQGTPYLVGIRAVNTVGAGLATSFVSRTPAVAPGAPTITSATGGVGSATVVWTAPASNGGSAITSYTVTSSGPLLTCTTATTTCTVTGLMAGSYTFTVKATNSAATSIASGVSASATVTAGVAGAPTGVSGVAGNAQATVTWTAPSSTGGAAITSYTATASPGGATCSTAGTSCTISSLTNGTAYTFTVKATNSAGTSAASSASSAVTPTSGVVAPGAPKVTSVTAGNGTVTVNVAAVSGGAPTLYTVTSSPGGFTCSTTSTSCTVSGLTNGTSYTFTATAGNSAGTSAASAASAAVTPTASTTTPTTPATPAAGTLDPIVPSSALSPGKTSVVGGGAADAISVAPNKANTGIELVGSGWQVGVAGSTGGRNDTKLGAGKIIEISSGAFVRTQGAGYKPLSDVEVYMMSTPTLVGTVRTDVDGRFNALLPLPAAIAAGSHTLQVNGFRPDLQVLSVSVGVKVLPATKPIIRRATLSLASPTLDAATKKVLDTLVAEPKRSTVTAALRVEDARTASQIAADPTLAKRVAASVAKYLKSKGVKAPVKITYVASSGARPSTSKGILVGVTTTRK